MQCDFNVLSPLKTPLFFFLLRSAASLADWPPKKLTWCYGKINAIKCTRRGWRVPRTWSFVEGLPDSASIDVKNNDNKIAETDDGVIHQKESPFVTRILLRTETCSLDGDTIGPHVSQAKCIVLLKTFK